MPMGRGKGSKSTPVGLGGHSQKKTATKEGRKLKKEKKREKERE
jgi:hypothetical protein